jgi:CheY-like chemotaxis protein
MPRMGGTEFLAEPRDDPSSRPNVVFVMTTSDDENDRARAYARNVADYILKFEQEHGFQDAILMLEHFSRVVAFPNS